MVALISEIPPEMCYCFWFMIFLGTGSSSGLHLSFLTIIALTPRVRKQIRIVCQCWVCLYQHCSILELGKWPQVEGSPGPLLWFHPCCFCGNCSPPQMPSRYSWQSSEPFTCTPLLKPVFTEAAWHLLISIVLVPILQDELCPQTLAVGAATDQQYGCLEAAEG